MRGRTDPGLNGEGPVPEGSDPRADAVPGIGGYLFFCLDSESGALVTPRVYSVVLAIYDHNRNPHCAADSTNPMLTFARVLCDLG